MTRGQKIKNRKGGGAHAYARGQKLAYSASRLEKTLAYREANGLMEKRPEFDLSKWFPRRYK